VQGILTQRELQIGFDEIGGPQWCESCGGRIGVCVSTSFGEGPPQQFSYVACEDCGEKPVTQ